ncbi:MAG TPA: phosphoribosylformylglycinamidine synthase subunit PurS [Thermoanaerobaculia bacterium]|nr:phosphoribosylformylglycinamidine synthase subunit PurS [Thermoanaerobaculia bacterium]
MKARVTVYPRREILDPQGKAIRDALSRIGFAGVEDVRAGKCFEIQLGTDDPAAAESQLRDMCQRLLANTVVEDYAVEILRGDVGVKP